MLASRAMHAEILQLPARAGFDGGEGDGRRGHRQHSAGPHVGRDNFWRKDTPPCRSDVAKQKINGAVARRVIRIRPRVHLDLCAVQDPGLRQRTTIGRRATTAFSALAPPIT